MIALQRSPCLDRGPLFSCERGDTSHFTARVLYLTDNDSGSLYQLRKALSRQGFLVRADEEGSLRFSRSDAAGNLILTGSARKSGMSTYEVVLDNY